MDFEVGLGMLTGGALPPMGTPISVNEAEEYVFGFVLMNDWSARDIQTWESNRHIAGKKFATTISPWIVTQDALAYCNTSLPK